MSIRTDLVIEENLTESKGFKSKIKSIGDITIEISEISDTEFAKKIKKPIGKYCTLRFERLDSIPDTETLKSAIVYALGEVSKTYKNALIVGLGNSDITPDALGPMCADSVIATRHITDEIKKELDIENLNTVSCIIPGVLGKTGIEAVDIIKAAVDKIKPDFVLAIDALAARTPHNLCKTIQMTNSGIAPGSGVKNERKALNRENLGIPVIAVGMPTVIDAGYLFEDADNKSDMIVTPKEIDLIISRASYILASALNTYLQPDLDRDTIELLS